MSLIIRPLLAVAALALATPAFAQVSTPATPATAPTTQTATKTDVKTPDTAVKTDVKGKSDTKTTTGAMEKKDKSSKVETKGKVSANTHHHGKVTKKA